MNENRSMASLQEDDEISKTAAKRKFLLTNEDLAVVPFKLKPNPMNKGYAQMKVYKKCDVEKIAVEKHGDLEEIEDKQNKKTQEINAQIENKDKETRNLWECEEIYEPMKQFMSNIDLPFQRTSQCSGEKQSFHDGENKQILVEADGDVFENDIIIHYFDCMHHRAKGQGAYAIHTKFPNSTKLDQDTPYNDRKKLGHFCWLTTESDQLIVILYVIHKFPRLAPNRPVVPVMNYDALQLGLQRLSNLIEKKLDEGKSSHSLSVGTYLPYKVDQTKFAQAYNTAFSIPVHLHTNFPEPKT